MVIVGIFVIFEVVLFKALKHVLGKRSNANQGERLMLCIDDISEAVFVERECGRVYADIGERMAKGARSEDARIADALSRSAKVREGQLVGLQIAAGQEPPVNKTSHLLKMPGNNKSLYGFSLEKAALYKQFSDNAKANKANTVKKLFRYFNESESENAPFIEASSDLSEERGIGAASAPAPSSRDSDGLDTLAEPTAAEQAGQWCRCHKSKREPKRIYVCPTCGKIEVGARSAYCTICATPCYDFIEM